MDRLKFVKKWLAEHGTLPALFLIFIGLAAAMYQFGNNYISGLGSNLIAEFIGAAATVYGIDYLIKRREEKRQLPVKAASYEDVRVMTHWALDLWKNAYMQSVGDAVPSSWEELLARKSTLRIALCLDITKPANTIPQLPWGNYFDLEMDRIHKHAEKVLERHGGHLDPSIHGSIYTIVYYRHHNIADLFTTDKARGIPRPTNLGSHYPIIDAWFDAVLAMHNWTVSMHPYLEKNGITNIHPPYFFSQLQTTEKPPAGFDGGVLESQARAYSQWQNQQST